VCGRCVNVEHDFADTVCMIGLGLGANQFAAVGFGTKVG
jgi:hypothetical protein